MEDRSISLPSVAGRALHLYRTGVIAIAVFVIADVPITFGVTFIPPAALFLWPIWFLPNAMVTAAVTEVSNEGRTSIRSAAMTGLRRYPAYLGSIVLLTPLLFVLAVLLAGLGSVWTESPALAMGLAAVLAFPALHICLRVLLAPTAVIVSGLPATQAISASWTATRGRLWRLVGVYVPVVLPGLILEALVFPLLAGDQAAVAVSLYLLSLIYWPFSSAVDVVLWQRLYPETDVEIGAGTGTVATSGPPVAT